jgi:competence protein ComEA
LAARFPLRLDPGRRTAVVVGVAVLVVAIVTGAWLLADRPQALAVGSAPATRVPGSAPDSGGATQPQVATSPAPAESATSASAAPDVVVDVAGKVHHPGVYRLPVGSRVDDAVRAAGGALPGVGVNGLNLAARVVDGQQIPVGIAAAAPLPGGTDGPVDTVGTGGGAAGGAGKTTPGAPVDVNTATLDQLQTLPGVGPVLAQHILDWRTAHGHFASVDELNDVSGIGDVKFAGMRSLVTV